MAEHRAQAAHSLSDERPKSWIAAVVIIGVWIAALSWIAWTAWGLLHRPSSVLPERSSRRTSLPV
jgi:hypothetical protein